MTEAAPDAVLARLRQEIAGAQRAAGDWETRAVADPREPYGRLVRETWAAWAKEQPDPKDTWLVGWEDLDAGQREVDMRIGSAVAARAVHDAGAEDMRLRALVLAWSVHLPAVLRALRVAIGEAEYEAGKKPYRAALAALGGGEDEP